MFHGSKNYYNNYNIDIHDLHEKQENINDNMLGRNEQTYQTNTNSNIIDINDERRTHLLHMAKSIVSLDNNINKPNDGNDSKIYRSTRIREKLYSNMSTSPPVSPNQKVTSTTKPTNASTKKANSSPTYLRPTYSSFKKDGVTVVGEK